MSDYQLQNTIYRAIDTYTHPTDFPLLTCILAVRVLFENQDLRNYYRYIPRVYELRERLNNLLIQAMVDPILSQQSINEIHDVAIQVGCHLPIVNAQQNEYNRYINQTEKKRGATTLQAISSDSQNVHNSKINDNIKHIVQNLCKDYPYTRGVVKQSIYQIVSMYAKNHELDTIRKSLQFIEKNPSHFNIHVRLRDLLVSLFIWIQTHDGDTLKELHIRLKDELVDMSGMCSTGHMSRLVNVMQGFTENPRYILNINNKKYLKNIIYKYLTKCLQECNDEAITDGILDKTDEFKHFIDTKVDEKRDEWLKEFGNDLNDYISECIDEFKK